MSSTRRSRSCSRVAWTRRRTGLLVLALALVVCLGTGASAALARDDVNIVSQGEPPSEPLPPKVHYYKTIQAAVDGSKKGDWVLIEPGTYDEEVKVTKEHAGLYMRGMNRNTVIIDGKHEPKPEGSNGIEVFQTNNVWIENLTVRNFDRATADGPGGNEIWWNGGADSNKIGAHGWYGRYLTAYDDGLNGGYGIFTNNEKTGSWENVYASGFNDSGLYLGACPECKAHISKAIMEYNALGYSGSNSGGQLIFEESIARHNSTGIAPNSENPGDGPPPQNGACQHPRKATPTIKTTEIERCTIFRNNLITENDNLNAPSNASTVAAPWGAGVELPGDYGDLIEENTITDNPTDGVLGFEYPNPFPPQEDTIAFQLNGNRISDNTFSGNGTAGGAFAGDVMLAGGLFGKQQSTNNCLSGNSFSDATYPEDIEGEWGCQNSTTPNPLLGFAAVEYLLELQAVSESRTSVPQPVPGEQPTMPDPCEGVPTNPLCP